MASSLAPFSCSYSVDFPGILLGLGCSLVLSTYQSGKVILLSPKPDGIVQLPRAFPKPMGLAAEGGRLAVATRDQVVVLANARGLAADYPNQPGVYDGLFVPRASYFTGPLDIHDLAWDKHGRLIAVNTLFSCLCVIDSLQSFTPVWQPRFIERLSPDDCCHLNGLAMQGGAPRYVTALGATATRQGWRATKLAGGIVIDVASGETVLQGLAMPHSPRIYDDKLYVLNSANCELLAIDPADGHRDCIAKLPGYARGLCRWGDYLFIGLSRLRHDHNTFGDLPIAKAKALYCGIVAVHLPSGASAGNLRYHRSCEEIYDVQVLPGLLRPGIVGLDQDLHRRALTAPGIDLWAVEEDAPRRDGSG